MSLTTEYPRPHVRVVHGFVDGDPVPVLTSAGIDLKIAKRAADMARHTGNYREADLEVVRLDHPVPGFNVWARFTE